MQVGHVISLAGTASALMNGAERPLADGSPIMLGDIVKTGADSAVEIRFADDTVMAQGAKTTLTIDTYVYDPDSSDTGNFLLKMASGTFRMATGQIAESNADGVRLESPLATIGIRGTTTVHEIAADGREFHGAEILDPGKSLILTDQFGIQQLVTFMHGAVVLQPDQPMGPVFTAPDSTFDQLRFEAPLTTQGDPPFSPDAQPPPETDIFEGVSTLLTPEGDLFTTAAGPLGNHLPAPEMQLIGGDPLVNIFGEISPILSHAFVALDSAHLLSTLSIGTWNPYTPPYTPITFVTDDDTVPAVTTTTIFPPPTGSFGDDLYTGTNSADTYTGLTGDDTLIGNAGNDSLSGGADNDSITGDEGDDTIDGGTGTDVLSGGYGNDYITGGEGDDTIYGDDGLDTILGSDGNDWLSGGIDSDSISGEAGNDSIEGLAGDDSLFGGDNNDTIAGDLGNDSILGGSGDDSITGGEGNDTISAEAGNDYVDGDVGDDSIDGGSEADTIYGGAGADYMTGGTGTDYLIGGTENDTIYGGDDADTLEGGDGNDSMYGEGGADVLVGDSGNDSMYGGDANDTLTGGSGADHLSGGTGADVFVYGAASDGGDTIDGFTSGEDKIMMTFPNLGSSVDPSEFAIITAAYIGSGALAGEGFIYDNVNHQLWYDADGTTNGNETLLATFTNGDGVAIGDISLTGEDAVSGATAGADSLDGTNATETIDGLAGNDTIHGLQGDDTLYGNSGSDSLFGESGNDWLYGGNDNDSLFGDDGSDNLYGDSGNDSLDGGNAADTLSGGDGDDTLLGGNAEDSLNGDSGNDILWGGNGNDTLYGGLGQDSLYGESGDDSLFAHDGTLLGDTHGNLLDGGFGNDYLFGNQGNDTLIGGFGDDTLIGGTGTDSLTGSGGADVFRYTAPDQGGDYITDFKSGTDLFKFTFTSLGPTLDSDEFATTRNDYTGTGLLSGEGFVFERINGNNGDLWYDPDGTVSGDEVLIAHVTGQVDIDDITL